MQISGHRVEVMALSLWTRRRCSASCEEASLWQADCRSATVGAGRDAVSDHPSTQLEPRSILSVFGLDGETVRLTRAEVTILRQQSDAKAWQRDSGIAQFHHLGFQRRGLRGK